jgi:hypothetical protein
MLCPDGTLWGVVRLDKIGEGGEQPTDPELNTWIAGFPIEPLWPWQGFTHNDQQKSRATVGTPGSALAAGNRGTDSHP